MNESLDLTKILDGCPYGTEFYHSGYGRVWFIGINTELERPIHIKLNTRSYEDMWITSAGTLNKSYNGECLFFPSKDQRDWSKFERFWDEPKTEKFDPKTLQPFDKVLVRFDEHRIWMPDFFAYKDNMKIICAINGNCRRECIPYNDETKYLIGTTDDCPEFYKWWEE